MSYRIVNEDNRVYAVDDNGVEICGSSQPEGHNYWQLYLTQSVTKLTGLRTPPHREHYWGGSGRVDSTAWVEVVAALYSLAMDSVGAAA